MTYNRSKYLRATSGEGLDGLLGDIVDDEGLALGLEVLGHAQTHLTEADEADIGTRDR